MIICFLTFILHPEFLFSKNNTDDKYPTDTINAADQSDQQRNNDGEITFH